MTAGNDVQASVFAVGRVDGNPRRQTRSGVDLEVKVVLMKRLATGSGRFPIEH